MYFILVMRLLILYSRVLILNFKAKIVKDSIYGLLKSSHLETLWGLLRVSGINI